MMQDFWIQVDLPNRRIRIIERKDEESNEVICDCYTEKDATFIVHALQEKKDRQE